MDINIFKKVDNFTWYGFTQPKITFCGNSMPRWKWAYKTFSAELAFLKFKFFVLNCIVEFIIDRKKNRS